MTAYLNRVDRDGSRHRAVAERAAERAFTMYPAGDVPNGYAALLEAATIAALREVHAPLGGSDRDVAAARDWIAHEFAAAYLDLVVEYGPTGGRA